MGAEGGPKQNLLDLVEGEKMGFHPMCLYSKCSAFSENPIVDENQIAPNMNTTLGQRYVREGPYPSG